MFDITKPTSVCYLVLSMCSTFTATCPDLRIRNGGVQYLDTGSVKYAFPTCYNNYKLSGSNFLSCEDGVWQSPIPKCVAL